MSVWLRSPKPRETDHPPQRPRFGRRLAAVAFACALPFAGAAPAFAAPVDGALNYGDSLFTGIGNGGYDVKHYDVQLDYAHAAVGDRAAGDVRASTTITAAAAQELRSFSLDFEGMTVDSVIVNGKAASFARPPFDKAKEEYKLVITPASPVQGEFIVQVNYSGVPSTHIDNDGSSEGWVPTSNGVIALGQPVGTMAWLPSNNTPADKATYDVKLTIPTEMNGKPAQGVSNGNLVSTSDNGDGTTTWRWEQKHQQATMSAMIGIGNYKVIDTPVTLTDGSVIPQWSFVDMGLNESQMKTTEERIARMEEIHRFLESKYGRYPGGSTGIIVHLSNVGYALETQDRSYFPGVPGLSTLVHEVAHQWYGAAVTPNDWNSIWMSEGQATYASQMFNAEIGTGAQPGKSTAEVNHTTWSGTADTSARWKTPTAGMTNQVQLFDWQTYTRGGMTYEALRQSVGDDVFFKILKSWAQDNSGHSRSTADFIANAEAVSGKDLGAFFQDWLYDADKPAWPSTWTLDLSAKAPAGKIGPGDTIEYTLTAKNTGQVALAGTASIDLSDVLDDGTLDATSLPAGLTLDGTTLTWKVPALTGTDEDSVAFSVTLGDRAYAGTVNASATGTLGAFCGACTSELTTAAAPAITGDDLTEQNRGGLILAATVEAGGNVEIKLADASHDGETLAGLLFSEPTSLGKVEAKGDTVSFAIPAQTKPGAHRVAVLDSLGLLIGWGDITVTKAPVPGADATGSTNGTGTDGTGGSGGSATGADGNAGSKGDPNGGTTGGSSAKPTGLATTGSQAGGLIAAAAVVLAALGGTAMLARRRQRG